MFVEIVIIMLIILALLHYFHYSNKMDIEPDQEQDQTDYNNNISICVFDIDGTINVNIESARKAIDTCKKNNSIIAINTARPEPYYQDLDLKALGITLDDIKNDFYYGKYCNMMSSSLIADTKVNHMHYIQQKYNCNPKKMILFDDNVLNIMKTRDAGYKVILANNSPKGGLRPDVDLEIDSRLL